MVEDRIKGNVSEVLEAQKEKEDRKNNIILFNIPEHEDSERGNKWDRRSAANVCDFVVPDINHEIKIERLGVRRKPTPDIPSPKPRPIKVFLKDSNVRDRILKNARRLKNSAHQHVGISADKTKQERDRDYLTRNEFKKRKSDGEDIVLYRGEIYPKSEAPWLKKSRAGSEALKSKVNLDVSEHGTAAKGDASPKADDPKN